METDRSFLLGGGGVSFARRDRERGTFGMRKRARLGNGVSREGKRRGEMEKVNEKRSNRTRPFVVPKSDIGYQRMAGESESGNLPIYVGTFSSWI